QSETLGWKLRSLTERCPQSSSCGVGLLSAGTGRHSSVSCRFPSGKFSGRSHALAMEVNSMSQSVSSNTVQALEMLLVQARTQIVKYLPRHLDADKMIYVALETVRADSYLRQCEPQSIVQAVLEASQLGLMLGNKLGHAYLAPRRDKDRKSTRLNSSHVS